MKTSNKNASVKVNLEQTEDKSLRYFRIYQVWGYSIKYDKPMIDQTYLKRESAEEYIKATKEIYNEIYSDMWIHSELVWLS